MCRYKAAADMDPSIKYAEVWLYYMQALYQAGYYDDIIAVYDKLTLRSLRHGGRGNTQYSGGSSLDFVSFAAYTGGQGGVHAVKQTKST